MMLGEPGQRKRWRVGVIGAGYVSSYHLRALQNLRDVQIVGITDLDKKKAQKVALTFRIPFLPSSQELYAAHPDAVHILTPPSSHCALALEALDMGCHVFVEKPMAMSAEECERMIHKASEVKRTLSVDHSAKFDPTVQKALAIVKAGNIGAVVAVDYFRSSEYPPYRGGPMPTQFQEGGYPFRDLGVHALYLMEAFLGEIRDVKIWPSATGHHPHLFFDDWRSLVHCQKGIGHVHLSWTTRPMQHLLLVQGTQGVISLDLYLQTCVLHRKLSLPKPVEAMVNATRAFISLASQICGNSIRVATGKMVRSEDIHCAVREFHLARSRGSEPPISADEGKRMVTWLESAAWQADARKREVERSSAPPEPASVLVTGGTGFLGRALVKELLSRGARVRLLVRRVPSREIAQHPSVTLLHGDLGNPEAVERAVDGVATVYHLGATTHGSWADYECGTIWGTRNIVDACLRHRVRKLVYVSSLSVLEYASLPARARLDETAPLESHPDKRGDYAHAKVRAEALVVEAARSDALSAVILRPGNILGPGAEKTPPYGVLAFGNHWVVMGSGNILLPLIYIADVVDALLRAVDSDLKAGEVLHLVDPEQMTQREYIERLRRRLPQITPHYLPQAVLSCVVPALQCVRAVARHLPWSPYRLRSAYAQVEFDIAAARERLGWQPHVGIREGVKRTFGERVTHTETQPSAQPIEVQR